VRERLGKAAAASPHSGLLPNIGLNDSASQQFFEYQTGLLQPGRRVIVRSNPMALENLGGVSRKLRPFLLRQGFTAFRFLHFVAPYIELYEPTNECKARCICSMSWAYTSRRLLQGTLVVSHKLLNSFCCEIVMDIKTLPCSIQVNRFVCNGLQRPISLIGSLVDKICIGEGKR